MFSFRPIRMPQDAASRFQDSSQVFTSPVELPRQSDSLVAQASSLSRAVRGRIGTFKFRGRFAYHGMTDGLPVLAAQCDSAGQPLSAIRVMAPRHAVQRRTQAGSNGARARALLPGPSLEFQVVQPRRRGSPGLTVTGARAAT